LKDLIFALDPGSRHTGYGVITARGDELKHVAHGVIHLDEKQPLAERLRALNRELQRLFREYPAPVTVVEKIFFGKNADSAFKLGHARGVCLMNAADGGSQVYEYAARYVKKAVTGNGAADKRQVQMMIGTILGIRLEESAFDASDALSLAVCHARVFAVNARVKRLLEGAL
jgi:crossover junction endodeoxyribonuclease RuvC